MGLFNNDQVLCTQDIFQSLYLDVKTECQWIHVSRSRPLGLETAGIYTHGRPNLKSVCFCLLTVKLENQVSANFSILKAIGCAKQDVLPLFVHG